MKSYKYKFVYMFNGDFLFDFLIEDNYFKEACNRAISYAKHHLETNYMFLEFQPYHLLHVDGVGKKTPVMLLVGKDLKPELEITQILDMAGVTFITYRTDYNNQTSTIGIEFELPNDKITPEMHSKIVDTLKVNKQ